jgi:uncharacterized membrane protein
MKEFKNEFVWGAISALFLIMIIGLISAIFFSVIFHFEGLQTALSVIIVAILSSLLFEVFLLFYYIFSGGVFGPTALASKIEENEIKLKSLEMSKKEAQKRYYSGKLDEAYFKKLMQQYESEIISVSNEIEALKKAANL